MSKHLHTTQIISLDGWPFRIRKAATETAQIKLMLLLHGHLGDENSMWILTKPLPTTYALLAPRAPIQTGPDQFSWHEIGPHWPDIITYHRLAVKLLTRVNHWLDNGHMATNRIDVMGFSQGAVMSYALAILHPERIGKVAALAGFIPKAWKDHLHKEALQGKNFYIAHGTRDDVIPLDKACQAAEWLKEKGAQVEFCKADTGHKLSADCFKGLGAFFSTTAD